MINKKALWYSLLQLIGIVVGSVACIALMFAAMKYYPLVVLIFFLAAMFGFLWHLMYQMNK